jgi:post-segregation antitoxin (ccd killing protein)
MIIEPSKEERAKRWLEEDRKAIESWNRYVEK